MRRRAQVGEVENRDQAWFSGRCLGQGGGIEEAHAHPRRGDEEVAVAAVQDPRVALAGELGHAIFAHHGGLRQPQPLRQPLPLVLRRNLLGTTFETAGLEHRAAGRQPETQILPFERIEPLRQRQRGSEHHRRAAGPLVGARPRARRRRLDPALAAGDQAAGGREAVKDMVDHERQAGVGKLLARRHQRQHRHWLGAAPRHAAGRKAGVDGLPVEIGEGVVVDAARLLAGAGAAAAEHLLLRRGGEAQALVGRRGHDRHLLPGGDGARPGAAPVAQPAVRLDVLVLKLEDGERQLLEGGAGRVGDETADAVGESLKIGHAADSAINRAAGRPAAAGTRPRR
jgi:hypothetical protein